MPKTCDPWGPISSVLYERNNSDLVVDVIGHTGVLINWPPIDEKAIAYYSNPVKHTTRIRSYKPLIQEAYNSLDEQDKGPFAQIVAKKLLFGKNGEEIKQTLINGLNDIGWTITDVGKLETQNVLLSEQFFPAGSPFDAYVAIREILNKASQRMVIVDAYIGNNLFVTLGAMNLQNLSIQLLTSTKNLKADFSIEATNFRKQYSSVTVEVRTTPDFHDRFIVIDDARYYHIGASIKDAGQRACLISRLQDEPVIELLKQHIGQAWQKAIPLQ